MHIGKCQISIVVILAICLTGISPIFAGTDDDDGDHNGWDLSIGGGLMAVPIFWPDFDYHRGRAPIQLPGTTTPAALPLAKQVSQQEQLLGSQTDLVDQPQQNKPSFPQVSEKPALDIYNGKQVVHLEHGTKNNPYLVYDQGLVHLGALVGATFVHPPTFLQATVLTKLQWTRGEWAHRYAENHEAASKMKWAKTPKKVSDFETWEIGDWTRKNGISGFTIYAGVAVMATDARAGGITRGIWSRTIQKVGETLIRISLTRETESGPIARVQALPMTKMETREVSNTEDTRVYLFDLTKEDDRKAVELVLDKNMLPAKSLADDLAEDGMGTLLTTRQIKRERNTDTPFSIGIPFLARARWAKHKDSAASTITNHRDDTATTITSKAYLHQTMHRHVNAPKKNKGKKWKYFMHSHQHYNRSYAGIAAVKTNQGDKNSVAARTRHLDVQILFSHDNAKVEKFNKYAERISRKIGLSDVLLDTDYQTDARIGFVQIVYKLKVGNDALRQLIEDNANEELFTERAHEMIDDYFFIEHDPHSLCDFSDSMVRLRCIEDARKDAIKSLAKIEKYLLKLYQDDVEASDEQTARYLAKIARELSTSHFVLQTFLLSLPEKENGYGRLEIYGEQFLAKRLAVDPRVNHKVDLAAEDVLEEENNILLDWNRIDAAEDDLGFY